MAMPFCTLVLVWIDRNFMAPKCTAYWLCWSWPMFGFRSRKWMISANYGGTRIEPTMDWATKNKPTVLLVFSDGQFRQHYTNPKSPIVWLINDNPSFRAKVGKVIHYEA